MFFYTYRSLTLILILFMRANIFYSIDDNHWRIAGSTPPQLFKLTSWSFASDNRYFLIWMVQVQDIPALFDKFHLFRQKNWSKKYHDGSSVGARAEKTPCLESQLHPRSFLFCYKLRELHASVYRGMQDSSQHKWKGWLHSTNKGET